MAREYCLMCTDCKEFMDIHKFPLVPTLVDRSPSGIKSIQISQSDIEGSVKSADINNKDHHWIFDLIPFINAFVKGHVDHNLRIVDDSEPDYYWWPEHVGYEDWKEIVTNLPNELYLPRNLIDDLKIKEWIKAEDYLRSLKIVLYDELELKEYRIKFDQLVRNI